MPLPETFHGHENILETISRNSNGGNLSCLAEFFKSQEYLLAQNFYLTHVFPEMARMANELETDVMSGFRIAKLSNDNDLIVTLDRYCLLDSFAASFLDIWLKTETIKHFLRLILGGSLESIKIQIDFNAPLKS
jgi:hypothetical protein